MNGTDANNSFNFNFRSIFPYVQSGRFKPGGLLRCPRSA